MTTKDQDSGPYRVIFMPSGRRGKFHKGVTLLEAARQLGVDIESICAGRLTCGKCKIRIEDGYFQKHGIDSRQKNLTPPLDGEYHLLEQLDAEGYRLACSANIQGDLLISVPEESQAQKQTIRKSATDRVIDIIPSIRQYYVEVNEAIIGEHRGDWGRLQDSLSEEWELKNLHIDIHILRKLQKTLRMGNWSITVTIWQEEEVIDVQPGYKEGVYGLAVDIGTTTIAAYLCDLRTGKLLGTESNMNPQISYGEDLMSRISYANTHPDGLELMHKAVIDAINKLANKCAKNASIQARDINEAVIVGNTTMIHIFLGINPGEIGVSPFALANRDSIDVKARELGLHFHPGANVHVLPAEAGHVGADNVAVMIAEEPYHSIENILIVDVGTNAEILLGNKERMFSASSPTGPAFEGGQISSGMRAAPGAIERVRIDPETLKPRFRIIGDVNWSDQWEFGIEAPLDEQPVHLAAGICGSGIIEAVAEMYLRGIILPDGSFNHSLSNNQIIWNGRKGAYILAEEELSAHGKKILVTQEDVRNVQLAKGALYAGIKLLMKRSGINKIDRVILAGAFGSYIDPEYAMILGMIPDCDLNKVYAVGNAAGDGARIALLNLEKRNEAQARAHWVRYVETAIDPEFQSEFVTAMHIPHKQDSFPHLEGYLPIQQLEEGMSRRKRRFKRS